MSTAAECGQLELLLGYESNNWTLSRIFNWTYMNTFTITEPMGKMYFKNDNIS